MLTAAVSLSIRAVENRHEIISNLHERLAATNIPTDSIRILYDLFDLAAGADMAPLAQQIYDVARRSDNTSAQLDALRHLTNCYTYNDSMQETFLHKALTLPPNDDQRETVLFIKTMAANSRASKMDESELCDSLTATFNAYSRLSPDDIEQRVELLFKYCTMLQYTTQGQLLTDSYTDLEKLIDDYPSPSGALRSLFYTSATNAYTAAFDYKKAIYAEKKLIEVMEAFEKRYHSQRRKYRNYNRNYYNSYRRLLSNYPALSQGEIDYYYQRILDLASKDADVARSLAKEERPRIFYLMAKKRYDEALPIIKRQLDNPSNRYITFRLLKEMREAAKAVGDKEAYAEASSKYCDYLEELVLRKSGERYRELQIIYDVTGLRSQNTRLLSEKQEAEISAQRSVIIIVSIASGLLLILLVAMGILYLRSRRLTIDLTEANSHLVNERDNLARLQKDLIEARDKAKSADRKKTEFINNMSHEVNTPLNAIAEYSQFIVDCMEPEKRKYLDRYAKVIALNTELVTTIVNEVLDVATIENAGMHIDVQPVSARAICDVAIKSTASHLQPGVTMALDVPDDYDVTLNTDAVRLGQILFNLLNNAAKFTADGSITLSFGADRAKSTVTFTVTDTGCGIPDGQEEHIFSRFEQLDKSIQGCGLGLYICRLLATLLGGVINVDTSYRKGARLVLTLPVTTPQ